MPGLNPAYKYDSWDSRNRLTHVTVTSQTGVVSLEEAFTYDALDRRIGRTVSPSTFNGQSNTTSVWTAYDGSNPYADFNAAGTLTTRYLRADAGGLDLLLARFDGAGAASWYLTDDEGSVREVVAPDGAVLDRITYGPYGEIVAETNPSAGDRFKYAGGSYDDATGLTQFGRRWYDPVQGRWLSQDPGGYAMGDSNLYRYAANDPMNNVDPSGLVWQTTAGPGETPRTQAGGSSAANQGGSQAGPFGSGASAFFGSIVGNIGYVASGQAGTDLGDAAYQYASTDPNGHIRATQQFALGIGQGGLNVVEGAENQAIGLLNLLSYALPLPSGYAGSIPQHRWAKDLLVYEDQALHDLSAELGGGALIDLLSGGLGKIGAVNSLACKLQRVIGGSRALALAVKGASLAQGVYSASESSLKTVEALRNEDYGAAVLHFYRAATTIISTRIGLGTSCFVAGTPLLTPDGSKPIEAFRPGDLVLARDQHDPNGPTVAATVVRTFANKMPTLKLIVAGRPIETTAAHPFWVEGRGWTSAGEIVAGDLLLGHDGRRAVVSGTEPGEAFADVYNLEVADYHSYFVGDPGWDFSA